MDVHQFRKECLEAHNQYRKIHGADPLQELAELTKHAQEWAEHMARTANFSHSYVKGYGENIAYKMQYEDPTGGEITKMWYDEVQNYDWGTHKSKERGKAIGHFTQVVWKGTTHAGFGIAQNGKKYYAVGNYKPAGNITNAGYYEKNVGPPCKQEKTPEQDSAKEDVDASETTSPTSGDGKGEGESSVPEKPVETKSTEKPSEQKDEDDDDNDDDDGDGDKKPGNQMSRPVMKAFRKGFMDRVNKFRVDNGTPSLKKDKDLQKLAQKCANAAIKGKERHDEVRCSLRMTSSSLQTGEAMAENVKTERRMSEKSTKIFDDLMSTNFGVVGIGVSSTKENGDEASHIIVYLG